MTKNLDSNGLQSIADNYDLFYIDLWGVVHNGVNLHEKAITVLNELLKKKKMLVLLTNAPRPNKTVQNFLEKMGMGKVLRDHVFTSGEAALNYLKKSYLSKKFYHIGPPRDFQNRPYAFICLFSLHNMCAYVQGGSELQKEDNANPFLHRGKVQI